MEVNVIIADVFQLSTGGVTQVQVCGETIGDCLRSVAEQYPQLKKVWFAADGSLSKFVLLTRNDHIISDDAVNQPVSQGDELLPMLRMVGG